MHSGADSIKHFFKTFRSRCQSARHRMRQLSRRNRKEFLLRAAVSPRNQDVTKGGDARKPSAERGSGKSRDRSQSLTPSPVKIPSRTARFSPASHSVKLPSPSPQLADSPPQLSLPRQEPFTSIFSSALLRLPPSQSLSSLQTSNTSTSFKPLIIVSSNTLTRKPPGPSRKYRQVDAVIVHRATFIIADDHHLGSPGTKKPWRYGSPPQVGDKDACGNRENELGRQGHPNCLAPGVDESDTDGNGRNISLDESTIVEEDLPPPRISTTSHGGDVKPFRGNSNGLEDLGTAKTPPPRPTTSGEPVNAGDSMPVEEAWNAEEYERRDGEGFDWDLVADEINDASDEGWQEFDENWQPPPGFSNLGCPFGPIPKRRLRWSAFYEATLDTIWEDPMEPSTNTSPMSSTATLVNSSGSYSNETSI